MVRWQKAEVKSSVSLGFGFYKGQVVYARVLVTKIQIFDGESQSKTILKTEAKDSIELGELCNWVTSSVLDKRYDQYLRESKKK